MIGTTVGQYRILARIGEGGMGEVFRGEDTMLQRQVAIKVLRPELAKQKTLVERFRTEAVALARLNHPNIAAVYGLLQDRGQFYMVLEYVDGETLEAIIARRGALPWDRAVQVAKDTLAALDHAHRMGVVHRDLKPSNLMLTRAGQLKVMDFGIARLAGTSRHTEFGRIVGTPLYMSPEQLRGEDVDGRSDVYSLGVVLYELLTGREAFQADSDYALLMAQLNQMPVPASRFVADLPAELESALIRSMEKPKAERWTSASAFRRALTAIVPEPVTEEQPLGVVTAGPTRVVDSVAPHHSPATPATRLATPGSVPATRLADLVEPAPPTRVAAPARAILAGVPARATIGVAALVLVVSIALATRSGPKPPPPPLPPQASKPAPEPAPTPPPALPPVRPPVAVAANFGTVVEDRPAAKAPNSQAPRYGEVVGPNDPPRGKGRPAAPKNGAAGAAPDPNPPTSPAPSPAPTPAPAPSSVPGDEPADLSAAAGAFRAGLAEIAGNLKTRDVAAVERGFTGDAVTKASLLKLLKEFPLAVEKESLAETSTAPGGRAIAEYSATLRWRSSFGNTRKVPVRIVATFGRDGGGWRLTSWRFAGKPDLD